MYAAFTQEWLVASKKMAGIQGRFIQALLQKNTVNQQGLHAVLQDAAHSTTQFCIDNIKHPATLLGIERRWAGKQLKLCKRSLLKALGRQQEAVIEPNKGDDRFSDRLWNQLALFDYIKQSYLLFCEAMEEGLQNLDGEDKQTKRRIAFYQRQILNALSPDHFILTNPELLKLTWDSKGTNLLRGFERYIQDLEHSASVLNIRMTQKQKFRVGDNIACTPGKVVYRNHLFELIQYFPGTDSVAKEPLLIVPPFVNKYYILDLTREKSFIRWAVDQGQTVFVVSWINPGESQAETGFEDYVKQGAIEAASQVQALTGQVDINAIGYCIGGTVLAMALALLKQRPQSFNIKSATFFTTLLDFEDAGDINVFIDDHVVEALARQNNNNGYFDGRLLSVSFSLMRENTLYWNYFVQNYLKGEDPAAFDLLYWNSDSTNIAAATHNFMLQELYAKNVLIQPGGVVIDGYKLKLSDIDIPSYFISTHLDHIAYWDTTYRGAQHLGGDCTFVLGESGHIAGIVNPPLKGKYGYYLSGDDIEVSKTSAEDWFRTARHHSGSWWPHWSRWLAEHCTEQVPARECGADLGDAPGEYVKKVLA